MTDVEIVQMVQQEKNKDNEDLSDNEDDEEGVQEECPQLHSVDNRFIRRPEAKTYIFCTRNYYCPHSARMSQCTKTKVCETKEAG